ncbi:hypothetical protein SLEP1_g18691 [Rubroshorea leprosula]|uniref:MATH domain-containing protein n=1 Tax=Rubroshorea leprosula TaxID=152421 RepID=A0AAV5J4C5_9ROSI|nr:hypothetical protein SLEP1_g18691 [Rubroshorea leprosula]
MASSSVSTTQDGVERSISDAPPTHYVVKIQLFSLLLKNSVENYESGDFEAGSYKWKLILYPSGNKGRNVKDHISLYLAIADTDSVNGNSEVRASFKLFLLDQNKDNYLVVNDATVKERRFHGLRNQWGFDQFLPLRTFNDVSNGYLVDDTCVLGAEVFVTKEMSTGKGEHLSMIKDATSSKHIWRIESFSTKQLECYDSQTFLSGDYNWKIQMYPKGRRLGLGSHISLYLALADPKAIPSSSKIFTEFILRMVDQTQPGRHISGKASYWFSGSNPENGWSRFVSFVYFNQPINGVLLKDVCVVEAEVTVLGVTSAV